MHFKTIIAIATLAVQASCWSPTDSYAPGNITCPSDEKLVRAANNISQEESDWIESRHKITDKLLVDFLDSCDMEDFDANDFINNQANRSLSIGIAFSGGGYRAMLAGAGQLSALDNRTTNASEAGLGGLLQCSTYLAGLSGGNWLVGTIAMNNFTSVQKIIDEGVIWDLKHSIIDVGGWDLVETYEYYDHMSNDIDAKEDAGFEVSLTDAWGRALSFQFFSNTSDYGAALTWSTLQDANVFLDHEMPFPIVVTDNRAPGSIIISGNSTIFEVNPFEIGSWDPNVYQFAQVKYIGTDLEDGYPVNGTCIGGYDNAGFIMGTSSTLFNQFILELNTTSLSSVLKSLVHYFLEDVSKDDDDIAIYKPNPFYSNSSDNTILNNDTLYLVDGGEDDQNIPLYPLLQPARQVDVIFAYDNSADTDLNWPNGTSLIYSYERQFLSQANGTMFPYVPDAKTMINLNLTARPTFFGCDAKNLTSLFSESDGTTSESVYDVPLIVYTANRPFSYYSNTSTFKLSYEEDEKLGMIENGFQTASRLNLTLDDEWKACVGCAIIRREQERLGLNQTEQCQQCFSRYCWDGSIDEDSVGVNFTLTGTTNGDESTGNTTGAGNSLIFGGNSFDLFKLVSFAFLTSAFFTML